MGHPRAVAVSQSEVWGVSSGMSEFPATWADDSTDSAGGSTIHGSGDGGIWIGIQSQPGKR